METKLLIVLFAMVVLTLLVMVIFIRKSHYFRCRRIYKQLKTGKRKWYLVSVQNGLVYAILPLKSTVSLEFGKLDEEMVLLDLETLTNLIKNQKEKISNTCFVEEILSHTEVKIQKYEPAINK